MPRYETKEDRKKEKSVAEVLSVAWGMRGNKLPALYPLDYCFTAGSEIKAFVEIKNRNCLPSTFPDIMLDVTKWLEGIKYAEKLGTDFIFAVGFKNGEVYCYTYKHTDTFPVKYGGRTKKVRDKYDIEPVVHISMDQFEKVGELRA